MIMASDIMAEDILKFVEEFPAEDYDALRRALDKADEQQQRGDKKARGVLPIPYPGPVDANGYAPYWTFVVVRPSFAVYRAARQAGAGPGGQQQYQETLIRGCLEYPALPVFDARREKLPAIHDIVFAEVVRLAGFDSVPLEGKVHPLLLERTSLTSSSGESATS